MTQMALFSQRGTSPQSLAAYDTVDRDRARAEVLAAIAARGQRGATTDELVDLMGWPVNRISGRVTELVERGLCSRGPDTRKTRAGRQAAIVRARE